MVLALAWSCRDRIVSTVVPPAPPRGPVYMAAARPEEPDTYDTSELLDLSFDFDLQIDAVEYSRIMRRCDIVGDSTVTRVNAFNSSI
jgi:hypothetical protein